jgi:hypothetical protein
VLPPLGQTGFEQGFGRDADVSRSQSVQSPTTVQNIQLSSQILGKHVHAHHVLVLRAVHGRERDHGYRERVDAGSCVTLPRPEYVSSNGRSIGMAGNVKSFPPYLTLSYRTCMHHFPETLMWRKLVLAVLVAGSPIGQLLGYAPLPGLMVAMEPRF